MMRNLSLSLIAGGVLALASCSKEEADSGPSSSSATTPEGAGASESSQRSIAYQESVSAGLNDLDLSMSFLGEDGERQEWTGKLTIVKDRFATVEHSGSMQKVIHLRRWSDIHLAEIPQASAEPANNTVQSPLTNRRLIADLMDSGSWKHRLEGMAADRKGSPDVQRMLSELDRVESGVALFYQNHKLAVGESWQVPVKAMARWFGDSMSEFSGDINVKVDREEALEGEPCVVMTVALAVQGKMTDPSGDALDVSMEGQGEIWRSVALNQDLQVEINGDATLKAAVPKQEITMVVKGPLNIIERRKLRK